MVARNGRTDKSFRCKRKRFSNWKGVDLFNIRFLPMNISLNDPYFEIPLSHAISEQSRYSFAFFKDEFNLSGLDEDGFTYTSSTDDGDDDDDGNHKQEFK